MKEVIKIEVNKDSPSPWGNFATGYFKREDLLRIPLRQRKLFQIDEYTEATELLHGYTLIGTQSMGNNSGIQHDEWLEQMTKQIVLEAAKYISGKDQGCGI